MIPDVATPARSGLGIAFGRLLEAEYDSSLREVVRRQFHRDFVAGQDLDVVLAHFPGNVTENFMTILQLNLEGCAGKVFQYFALHLNYVVFCHMNGSVGAVHAFARHARSE